MPRPKDRTATPRSFWVDPRLLIGVGLVIASVVGVYALVAATADTVEVYAAATLLAPGDSVSASAFTIERVRLGGAAARYLTPDSVPATGAVMTRGVAAGELVPVSAIGDASSARVASVVVAVAGDLAQSIGPGSVVDVWSSQKGEQSTFGPPAVLVSNATVVRVLDASGLISGSGQGVEVLVPRDDIARVLAAVANADAIALVPVSIPIGR